MIPRDDESPSISGNTLRHCSKIRGNARHRARDNKAFAAKGTLQAPARCTKEDSQKHSEHKNTHLLSVASWKGSVDLGVGILPRVQRALRNRLHSRSEDSGKLMGVHITHNLVEEKGAWFP